MVQEVQLSFTRTGLKETWVQDPQTMENENRKHGKHLVVVRVEPKLSTDRLLSLRVVSIESGVQWEIYSFYLFFGLAALK